MGAQVLTRALNAKLPLLVVAMGRYSPLPNLAVGKQLVKFLLIGRGPRVGCDLTSPLLLEAERILETWHTWRVAVGG